jgi:hypothetical protein
MYLNDTRKSLKPRTPPPFHIRHEARRHNRLLQLVFVLFFLTWLSLILFGYNQLYISTLQPENNQAHGVSFNGLDDAPLKNEITLQDILDSSSNDSTDSSVVHIMHTRFMQQQPLLIDLGLARLKLFQSFFLRSLEIQTSENFLLIIRTDPDLDDRLKQPLLDILQKFSKRYLLVASNENPNFQFRDLHDLDSKTVWAGDLSSATRYIKSKGEDNRYVLESRLDADDGLHKAFVESIQAEAVKTIGTSSSSWRLWCSSAHLEWQYESAWGSSKDGGSLVLLKYTGCVTAGLTVGYLEDIDSSIQIPTSKHNKLHLTLPSCGRHGEQPQDNCLSYLILKPGSLRARTATSAGMLNVILKNKNESLVSADTETEKYAVGAAKQKGYQDRLWTVALSSFGFLNDEARDLCRYFKEHLRAIAIDNLKGQCTGGHSCKNTTRLALQAIIDDPGMRG